MQQKQQNNYFHISIFYNNLKKNDKRDLSLKRKRHILTMINVLRYYEIFNITNQLTIIFYMLLHILYTLRK